MYRIINVTDNENNTKVEAMKEMMEKHPGLTGALLYPVHAGMSMCLVWADRSDTMMRTSTVQSFTEDGCILKVTTKNSIYTLEEI